MKDAKELFEGFAETLQGSDITASDFPLHCRPSTPAGDIIIETVDFRFVALVLAGRTTYEYARLFVELMNSLMKLSHANRPTLAP